MNTSPGPDTRRSQETCPYVALQGAPQMPLFFALRREIRMAALGGQDFVAGIAWYQQACPSPVPAPSTARGAPAWGSPVCRLTRLSAPSAAMPWPTAAKSLMSVSRSRPRACRSRSLSRCHGRLVTWARCPVRDRSGDGDAAADRVVRSRDEEILQDGQESGPVGTAVTLFAHYPALPAVALGDRRARMRAAHVDGQNENTAHKSRSAAAA
jgi:hypothetical protein